MSVCVRERGGREREREREVSESESESAALSVVCSLQ